jgi:hypothetical protein
MAALALVPPAVFKQVLEHIGWTIATEGKYNWTMAKDGVPLTIPKQGKLVSRGLLEACLQDGILTPGDYFDAIRAVGYKL